MEKTKRLQLVGKLPSKDELLPSVTENDNGKIMRVVNGAWVAVELPTFDGEYVVTPQAFEDQTLQTAQTFLDANIKVEKIPYAEVSNSTKGKTATIG